MKVTYISHSGFLIETKNCLFLFDYYEGKIPPLSQEKPLFIFVSHWHSDHFNPEIFSIRHEKVHYILSHDTRKHLPAGISPENLCFMKPEEKLDFTLEDGNEHFTVETLKSTDCGVAFLIYYRRKYLYHAGDLNWWYWNGEPEEDNEYMIRSYKEEVERLRGRDIDLAFLLLDPRQEDKYCKGINYFIEEIHPKVVFPMHAFGEYKISRHYLNCDDGRAYQGIVREITRAGEEFTL